MAFERQTQTQTKVQSTSTRKRVSEVQTAAGPTPEERLLEERRAFYYGLVDRIFDKNDEELNIKRTELAGLSLYEVLGMYAGMRTSREIDLMQQLLQRTGNLWFSIAGAGKEIINLATAAHM